MISFYPGPSRVHDGIPGWTADAARKGILSMSHRSQAFMDLSKDTITLLRQRLRIPKTYTIFFVSSATECWEIIAQSVIATSSIHLYNGAFGEKWLRYTQRLRPAAEGRPFDLQQPIPVDTLELPSSEVICITQNETSNGTAVTSSTMRRIRKKYPDPLIAVDATSSMAGVALNFSDADIWFASVQKCFGLPAGLAVMVCSERALERTHVLKENQHYNSLTFMAEMMRSFQTTHTPNVLGIYLLNRALTKMKSIKVIDKETTKRAQQWFAMLDVHPSLQPFITNRQVRSKTVVAVSGNHVLLEKLKVAARKKGFLLGEGYGEYKKKTIRIANFPAISNHEIRRLMRFLTTI